MGVNNHMRIPGFGLFGFPDGLVPLGPFPLVSPFPSPSESLLVSVVEWDLLLCSYPFSSESRLKLHESPHEHWPFEVH